MAAEDQQMAERYVTKDYGQGVDLYDKLALLLTRIKTLFGACNSLSSHREYMDGEFEAIGRIAEQGEELTEEAEDLARRLEACFASTAVPGMGYREKVLLPATPFRLAGMHEPAGGLYGILGKFVKGERLNTEERRQLEPAAEVFLDDAMAVAG